MTPRKVYQPVSTGKACLCGADVMRLCAKGRTPDYCSDDCRETQKLLWRLAGHLDRIGRKATSEAKAKLRATVWSSLNASLNVRGTKRTVAPVVANDISGAEVAPVAFRGPNMEVAR